MGGKSTFLRQNALIVLLAQIGSFVPAERAKVGLVDRIFARVGAGDNLAENESTFFVEMNETAHILRHATRKSFVVLDEVGRGTSPEDGLALATAITRYLHGTTQCRTLAATHLLSLPTAVADCAGVDCYRVDASVPDGEQSSAVFSHRVVPGAAESSFGLAVARLAGIPSSIVDAAAVVRKSDPVVTIPQAAPADFGVLTASERGLVALYRQWTRGLTPPPADGASPGQILRSMYHFLHNK